MYEKYLERILIVMTPEANREVGRPLHSTLMDLGYDCNYTDSFTQTRIKIQSFKPDLILAWWTTESDGRDVMDLARSAGGIPTVAIAVTGPPIEEVVKFCQGMALPNQLLSFISHPINPIWLQSILHAAANYNHAAAVRKLTSAWAGMM